MTVELPREFLELTKDDGQSSVSTAAAAALVQKIMQNDAPVEITSLKGGITNELLLAEQDGIKMLVRAFGRGTGSFIDRQREFAVHQQLQTLGLAPTLYGKFGNGLVYGFIPGSAAAPSQLGAPTVMRQVSRRLAQWHATLSPRTVAAQLPNGLDEFWTVLGKWVDLCPEGVLPLSNAELRDEFARVRAQLGAAHSPQVMGHCDLLSANILLPNDSHDGCLPSVPHGTDPHIASRIASDVAFIDYEYAIPCPRAFDIANHFQEWQGYECDKSRVPEPSTSSPQIRAWCTEYLTAYGLLVGNEQALEQLVAELQLFWGMPGFYWGVWSAIQSHSSAIDFGYADYAANRFQEYLDWKARL